MFEKIFTKRRGHLVTNRIRENDLKGENNKGEIILTHYRGHETILIFFFLKVFKRNIYFYFQDITAVDNNNGVLFFM